MVLSVKRAANAQYYFQGIAHLATREPDSAQGMWLAGHAGLGVQRGAQIIAKDLDRLLRRMTAHSGQSPTFGPSASLSGHDFVFSAPKAVSLVWALARDQRAILETAHKEAVKAAVRVLLREVVRERVGQGGRQLRFAHAAAGAFLHTLCRPAYHPQIKATFPDPNLHTHVLVPDIVISAVGAKGRCYKVAYTTLYGRWAMALGAWYHAHLAYRLREAGYHPIPCGPNGVFTLEGIDPLWVSAFSARTEGARHLDRSLSLEESLARTKERKGKPCPSEVEDNWGHLSRAVGCKVPHPEKALSLQAVTGLADPFIETIGAALEADNAVLQLCDLYRGLAAACVAKELHLLPGPQHVKQLKQHDVFVPLPASASYALPQWTTARNRELEQTVQETARKLHSTRFEPAPLDLGSPSTAGLQLTLEQQQAASEIASDRQLAVLQGSPGTGKTSLLEPVIRSYQAVFGKDRVIGLAEGWLQALQLKARFDIPCYSLAAFFTEVRRQGLRLGEPLVLIVDEAGLLSTRRMNELLETARRCQMKLIFLGDPQQLDPLGAGSGLRLINGLGAITLTEILRQKTPEAGAIVGHMAAIATHRQKAQEGLNIAEERRAVRDTIGSLASDLIAGDYWKAYGSSDDALAEIADRLVLRRQEGPCSTTARILVTSHREAQHLTRLVRERLRKAYLLHGDDVVLDAITPMGQRHKLRLACGDHVRFLVRNKDLGIYNGTEGEIRAIRKGVDPELTVELFEGTPETVVGQNGAARKTITVKASDIRNEARQAQLACAYAMTIYGAQGSTFEEVTILKSSRLTFRQFYVAVSRASRRFRIIDVSREKLHWQDHQRNDHLISHVRKDLLAMEGRDRLKPLACETTRRSNSPRPEPSAWTWQIMTEDAISATL